MKKITFAKVKSIEDVNKVKDFLNKDVEKYKGSAGHIVDSYGKLILILVCYSPWGNIVINKQVSRLEALVWFFGEEI